MKTVETAAAAAAVARTTTHASTCVPHGKERPQEFLLPATSSSLSLYYVPGATAQGERRTTRTGEGERKIIS